MKAHEYIQQLDRVCLLFGDDGEGRVVDAVELRTASFRLDDCADAAPRYVLRMFSVNGLELMRWSFSSRQRAEELRDLFRAMRGGMGQRVRRLSGKVLRGLGYVLLAYVVLVGLSSILLDLPLRSRPDAQLPSAAGTVPPSGAAGDSAVAPAVGGAVVPFSHPPMSAVASEGEDFSYSCDE